MYPDWTRGAGYPVEVSLCIGYFERVADQPSPAVAPVYLLMTYRRGIGEALYRIHNFILALADLFRPCEISHCSIRCFLKWKASTTRKDIARRKGEDKIEKKE